MVLVSCGLNVEVISVGRNTWFRLWVGCGVRIISVGIRRQ